MQNIIRGKVFVLGDNIDTDQIIPAKFLSPDKPKKGQENPKTGAAPAH